MATGSQKAHDHLKDGDREVQTEEERERKGPEEHHMQTCPAAYLPYAFENKFSFGVFHTSSMKGIMPQAISMRGDGKKDTYSEVGKQDKEASW